MRALIAPVFVLLTLAACGKAGAPVAPGSNFPRPYPNPNLSPTAALRAAPEDQAGLSTDDSKAKFTNQGSYIDPAVRSTELSRGAAGAGANLLYSTTHNSDGTSTPFNQGLGGQTQSPLPPVPDTTPNTVPDPEPQ